VYEISKLEGKLMQGMKLSISREIGTEFSKWVVWLAHCNGEYVLHLWKPTSGELKSIVLDQSISVDNDHDDKLITLSYHLNNERQRCVVDCEDSELMSELSRILVTAARQEISISTAPSSSKVGHIHTPHGADETKSSVRKSSSDGDISDESEEKQRKRVALGSISLRPMNVSRGRGGGRKINTLTNRHSAPNLSTPRGHDDEHDEDQTNSSSVRMSTISGVFGVLGEDENDVQT